MHDAERKYEPKKEIFTAAWAWSPSAIWMWSTAIAATLGVLGCGGSQSRLISKLPRQLCQRASKAPTPSVLAVGKTSDALPNFSAESLVLVRYTGCAMRVVPECQLRGRYSFQAYSPQGSSNQRYVMRATDVAVGAPNMTSGIGFGLGSSEAVGVEYVTRGAWVAPPQVVTTDEIVGDPACRTPGYVTHAIRAADIGAWTIVRDNVNRLQAQASFFGIGGSRANGYGSARRDFGGDPGACWRDDRFCSAPVRYYLSRIEPVGTQPLCAAGQIPDHGRCVPDIQGLLTRTRWRVDARLFADGCVDGVGGCELGYTISAGGRPVSAGRGAQDSNAAGPISLGVVPASAAEAGWQIQIQELDAFENDWLGNCTVSVPAAQLYDSASGRRRFMWEASCGEVRVQVHGDPL